MGNIPPQLGLVLTFFMYISGIIFVMHPTPILSNNAPLSSGVTENSQMVTSSPLSHQNVIRLDGIFVTLCEVV